MYVGSYDPVLLTYLSVEGPRGTGQDIFSKGITNTPCLDGTSILGLHPTKTLHLETSSSHMYPPQVPLVGNAQVVSPWQNSSKDSS